MKTDNAADRGAERNERDGHSRREQRRVAADAREQRARLVRWGGLAAVVLVVLAIGWFGYRQFSAPPAMPSEFPAPRGGSNQAQDVNSLVGQRAPAFTLSDAEGQAYTVTPGQGRPLVLVSHMGIT